MAVVSALVLAFASLPLRAMRITSAVADASIKIVVIEGADAVNIIQQKTAVAPVVEVRDDNDLPVAGALVTFAVRGSKTAAFAGNAETLTLTTNAAGRATATGFTPLTTGTVSIEVTATFSGQTAATTITQRTFLTVSEATSAGATTSSAAPAVGTGSGATAAGGGGLSPLAIVAIVAGGAGAGAYAASRLANENAAPTLTGIVPSVAVVIVGTETPISFSAQVTDPDNDTLTYEWDFGDGGTSSEPSPAHIYRTAGTFTVRLTVRDGEHSVTNETTVNVRTLTGRWRAGPRTTTIGEIPEVVLTLSQAGLEVTGTFEPVTGTNGVLNGAAINGTVSSSTPRIVLATGVATGRIGAGPVVSFAPSEFRLDPGGDGNTLTGEWVTGGPGTGSITFMRQ